MGVRGGGGEEAVGGGSAQLGAEEQRRTGRRRQSPAPPLRLTREPPITAAGAPRALVENRIPRPCDGDAIGSGDERNAIDRSVVERVRRATREQDADSGWREHGGVFGCLWERAVGDGVPFHVR